MGTIEEALKKRALNSRKAMSIEPEASNVNVQQTVDKQPKRTKPVEVTKPVTEAVTEAVVDIKKTELSKTPLKAQSRSSNFVTIDMKHLVNQGFLTPNDGQSIISEEFRQIKRPLLNNIRGKSAHPIKKANLIQVTSALQNEGKTFNAINLALSMAMEMDFKVLLVDADVIKPSITKDLNIEADKGLVEYLSGEVSDLSEVMLNTNIEKLTILPAGNRHNLTTELVSSTVMEHLFTELSERYSDRVVIIDSPPILQTNESVLISQKVGQIVFVVEQNSTTQADVESAIVKLDDDAVIGVVMNKSRSGDSGSYYGYGSE